MESYIVKGQERLRLGYTTGSCATAAAKAATWMLLTQEVIDEVVLNTPKEIKLNLEVCESAITKVEALCAIEKDGGDDPDVTHGMKIYAKVSRNSGDKIHIEGGEGIGRVTQPGLWCKVGEAAINPVPRQMIEQEVVEICKAVRYMGGIDVLIYAPAGKEIARKTFNARLGIEGGISILGTSGIVEPMSEQALVETIKAELRVLKARGIAQILICPGNYGRDFANTIVGLDLEKGVKYSNYLGETLDEITYLGFAQVLLVGHVGKLVKVAAGVMNTHSKYADARLEVLATHAALCGYPQEVIQSIMESVTTEGALELLKQNANYECVIRSIIKKIKVHIDFRVRQKVQVEIMIFGEKGLIGESEGAKGLVQILRRG
ncbi:MAG: cobalt-precorrin-5B (C(1))-methyltransferase CbiD [Niameybacter sp.]